MSPRSAFVPTSAVDGGQVLTRQHGLVGGSAPLVLEQALAVGAPGWSRDHHVAAEQRQTDALATRTSLGTPDAALVTPVSAAAAALAGPAALDQPGGSPTAAENAAIDALFDQAAHINVVLLAFVLLAVAGVLATVLARL